MSFCIKCGRDVELENLISGYCVDCFLKYIGVFESKPIIDITICPKCGSVLYKNSWIDDQQEKVIKEIMISKVSKFLHKNIELIDIVLPEELYRIGFGQNVVGLTLKLNINKRHAIEIQEKIIINVNPRVCARCLARSTGTHKALVQIRFEDVSRIDEFLDKVELLVNKSIHDLKLGNNVIDIEQLREGINIKFNDIASARKLVYYISSKLGAKIIESFKTTGFDSKHGKREGILTFSIRIPSFKKGDLITYKDKIGIITHVYGNKIKVWFPESSKFEELSISYYWSGTLRKIATTGEEIREYIVVNASNIDVVLSDAKTGEIKRISLKQPRIVMEPGDRVILISINNKEFIVPINTVGDLEQESN